VQSQRGSLRGSHREAWLISRNHRVLVSTSWRETWQQLGEHNAKPRHTPAPASIALRTYIPRLHASIYE